MPIRFGTSGIRRTALPGTARQNVSPAITDGASLNLSQVISALSFALDLTHDAVPGHAVRSCLLGMRIGTRLGLNPVDLNDLYYALLLKDIGCSSNAARMCQILGGDDRAAKRRSKFADWSRPSFNNIAITWRNLPPSESLWQKTRRLIDLTRLPRSFNAEIIALRCERGANIVRKIGLSDQCADAIHGLDEQWNGRGLPQERTGSAIPTLARILSVAQHLDVFATEQSRHRALITLQDRSGTWFDPELVRIAVSLDRDGALWNGIGSDEHARVLELEPGTVRRIDAQQIDRLCEAFSDVVDAKSSFTYRHSVGVMAASESIAGQFGLSPARTQLIRRAALLHDLGKLSIPNTILDKPSALDKAERLAIQQHPLISQRILERIPSFAAIATIAGRHHERLDGSGYPFKLTAETLSLEDRIVNIADVYGALSEDRPYRRGLPDEEIIRILSRDVPTKIDPDCFDALLAFLHRTPKPTAPPVTSEYIAEPVYR